MKRVWLLALVACAHAAPGPAPSTASSVPPPALFEFHSDPWVNLHQRLYAEAFATPYWHSKIETCACGKDSPDWAAAVEGYKKDLHGRVLFFDAELAETNLTLALAGEHVPEKGLDPAVAKWIPPVFEMYRRGQWPMDDARNKAWIAAAEPLVARWGKEIASEYEKRFRVRWPARPIRVEVTEWASFAGAYTTEPILTTMSSADEGYRGNASLEMLFHEASHGLAEVLTHDLEMAFIARGKRAPGGLDHAIIFYTAGALTKKRLGASYVPYADARGIWKRGPNVAFEAPMRQHWQAWLDDAIDYETALDRLATAL